MDDRKNLPDHETLTPLIHYSPKPDSGNLQKKSCFIAEQKGVQGLPGKTQALHANNGGGIHGVDFRQFRISVLVLGAIQSYVEVRSDD